MSDKIRAIIDSAPPGPWAARVTESDDVLAYVASDDLLIMIPTAFGLDGRWNNPMEVQAFIATFDPEHVALMEWVIGEMIACPVNVIDDPEAYSLRDAYDALVAHREKEGLR